MKYKDMVTTREGYHPVFDLENESPGSWKGFIPNDDFYKVLSTVLNSIEPSSGKGKKMSIWIRGAYGTGKSHATSVIKHLLWDDMEDIGSFLDDLDDSYAARIKVFREKNKVFPVVIKGASNIVDNRSFSAAIQKAVTYAFKQQDIKILTKNDFETYRNFIEINKNHYLWDEHIKDDQDLKIYVKTKADILKKLESEDVKVLQLLEKSIYKMSFNVLVPNITDWLKDVTQELRDRGIADYLMIFWDEFTSILELEQEGMSSGGVSASEWQNIAELSRDKNVYLFIVSHKFPGHYSTEDKNKTLDRFNSVNYVMQRLTTFHIMESAIRKTDKDEWNILKEKYVVSNTDLVKLIKDIVENEGPKITNTVIDLFPLHPYTSYLTTFISRYLGSAQRSVFNFLTDTDNGFLRFIEDNPDGEKGIFLTSDLLWDFFLDEFENMGISMAAPILEKYKVNRAIVEKAGEINLIVFKAILLLNILNYVTKVQESSTTHVIPSERNIKNMFLGTAYEDEVDSSLEYLNSSTIIEKNPHGIYEITASNLNPKKVNDEIDNLKDKFDLLKALTNNHVKELKKIFTTGELRHIKVYLYDAIKPEHILSSKLHKNFSECTSEIYIAVFIAKDQGTISKAKEMLARFSSENYFQNVVFVLSQEELRENSFDKYLRYKARANVAASINSLEEQKNNEDNVNKIIDYWIDEIKQQYALYFFRGEMKKSLAYELVGRIKRGISKEIYPYGLENTGARRYDTIWKVQKSKTAIETTLNAHTRSDLEKASGQFKRIQEILKDTTQEWVVNNKLDIKTDADKLHPIVQSVNLVKELMEGNNQPTFNLGEVLKPLSKPPYGYYENPVNQGTLGFLMRPYVNQIYDSTGSPVDSKIMRDKILAVFDYWDGGKEKGNTLQVRFGTIHEKELIDKLKDLFKLDASIKSLSDVRWSIGDTINKRNYPLWVYKEFTKSDQVKEVIDDINELIRTKNDEVGQEFIKILLDKVESLFVDLKSTFDEKNSCKDGFIGWLKQIVEITDLDIEGNDRFNELWRFVKQKTQEEVKLWSEDTVKYAVVAWKVTKQDTLGDPDDERRVIYIPPHDTKDSPPSDSFHPPSNKVIDPPPEYAPLVKTAQSMLDDFVEKHDIEQLKNAIVKAVEEEPTIWTTIQKYLGDLD